MFGNTLHLSGVNKPLLEQTLAPYQNNPTYHVKTIPTSLEDVFIAFVDKAEDNFKE